MSSYTSFRSYHLNLSIPRYSEDFCVVALPWFNRAIYSSYDLVT